MIHRGGAEDAEEGSGAHKLSQAQCPNCAALHPGYLPAQIVGGWFPSHNAHASTPVTFVCHSEERSDEESACGFPSRKKHKADASLRSA